MARGEGLALNFVILKAFAEEGELAKEVEGQQENQEDAMSGKGRACFQMKGVFKSVECC